MAKYCWEIRVIRFIDDCECPVYILEYKSPVRCAFPCAMVEWMSRFFRPHSGWWIHAQNGQRKGGFHILIPRVYAPLLHQPFGKSNGEAKMIELFSENPERAVVYYKSCSLSQPSNNGIYKASGSCLIVCLPWLKRQSLDLYCIMFTVWKPLIGLHDTLSGRINMHHQPCSFKEVGKSSETSNEATAQGGREDQID